MELTDRTAYDEMMEFLASAPSLEEISDFKVSDKAQARISHLLDKNRESTLTLEEQGELAEVAHFDHVISMLKIYVRRKLVERI